MTFVPSSTQVVAEGASPTRWALVLHGILGSGSNFRTLARKLVAASPTWGIVLVDLRMHGRSQGAPPPHTVEAASLDLVELARTLAPTPGARVQAVIGHSFGGKVALAYAMKSPDVDRVVVLDSPLAKRPHASTAEHVIATLHGLPERFASRPAFVEAIVAKGYSRAIADWLAMSLAPIEGGFRFGLDLAAIDAMMASYGAMDMWPVVAKPPGHAVVHVVVAEQSDAFDEADLARLSSLAAREPRLVAHLVPNAGHWIHADAPDAVLAILRSALDDAR